MAFVKHQKQTINGKDYEYWYIYESYYRPSFDHPKHIKLGKVGDSPSEIASNFREKADSKDLDISDDKVEELKNTVEKAQEMAESDEGIAEQIEKMSDDEEAESDSDEEDEEEKTEREKIRMDNPVDLDEELPDEYKKFESVTRTNSKVSYEWDRGDVSSRVEVRYNMSDSLDEEGNKDISGERVVIGYVADSFGDDDDGDFFSKDAYVSEDFDEVWDKAKEMMDSQIERFSEDVDVEDDSYNAKIGDKIEVKGTPPGVFAKMTGEWVILDFYEHSKGEAVKLGKAGKRKPVLSGSNSQNRERVLKRKLERSINNYDPEFSSSNKEANNGVFLRERGLEGEYIESESSDSDEENEDIENLDDYLNWYESYLKRKDNLSKDIDFDKSVERREKQIREAFDNGLEHDSIREDVAYPERLEKKNGKWAFVWTSDLTGNDAFLTVNKALDSAIVSESGDSMDREFTPEKLDVINQLKDKIQPVVDEYDGWQLDQTGDTFTVHDGEHKLKIEAREDYYALYGEDLENMVEAKGFKGIHDVKKDGDKYLRRYGSDHDVRDFIEFYNEDFPEIQETSDTPYVFGLFDRENDYKEIVFVENRDDDKFTPKALDLEKSEDRFEVLGSNGRKTRYDFMEAKNIVDSYVESGSQRDTVDVIHAENEGEVSEEFIEEESEGSEEMISVDKGSAGNMQDLYEEGKLDQVDTESLEDFYKEFTEGERLDYTDPLAYATAIETGWSGEKVDEEKLEWLKKRREGMGELLNAVRDELDSRGVSVKKPESFAEPLPEIGDKITTDEDGVYTIEDEEDDFDSKQAVKQLTQKGVIVSKDVADSMEKGDVELVESVEPAPMYIDEDLMNYLRNGENPDVGYETVEATGRVPDFTGTDGEAYTGIEEGDRIEVPEANAEILKNRGLGEIVEDDSSSEESEDYDDISEFIRDHREKFDCPAEDINNGRCDEFARDIKKEFPNAEIQDNEEISRHHPSGVHVWVKYDGKYYDSDVPEGVEDLADLPVWENQGLNEDEIEELKSLLGENDEENVDSENEGDDDMTEDDDDLVSVKFTQKVPEFMGTDLVNYGGFEKGDTAEIPRENAEILENKGSLEIIEGSEDGSSEALAPQVTDKIEELDSENGAGFKEVFEELDMSEEEFEETVDELKNKGMVYEPVPGKLKLLGLDEDPEEIDINRDNIESEEDKEKKENEEKLKEVIQDLDDGDGADYKDIVDELDMTEDKIEEAVNRLLSRGSAYEPRPGHIKLL